MKQVTLFARFPPEMVFTDVSFPVYLPVYSVWVINLPEHGGYSRQITRGAQMAFMKM